MEAGIVLALAYWGYQSGETTAMKLLLTIGAPLVGFGIWGAIDFHQAGQMAEMLRLFEELVISGLVAVALYAAGQPLLGWALGILSVVYHISVYLAGDRLLKNNEPVGSASG